jgi:hypothetical protein
VILRKPIKIGDVTTACQNPTAEKKCSIVVWIDRSSVIFPPALNAATNTEYSAVVMMLVRVINAENPASGSHSI